MTAIDWLVEKVNSDCLNSTFIRKELIDEAKEMEKQQIIKAAARGYLIGEDNLPLEDAKDFGLDYYISTYGSKGSDETKTN